MTAVLLSLSQRVCGRHQLLTMHRGSLCIPRCVNALRTPQPSLSAHGRALTQNRISRLAASRLAASHSSVRRRCACRASCFTSCPSPIASWAADTVCKGAMCRHSKLWEYHSLRHIKGTHLGPLQPPGHSIERTSGTALGLGEHVPVACLDSGHPCRTLQLLGTPPHLNWESVTTAAAGVTAALLAR